MAVNYSQNTSNEREALRQTRDDLVRNYDAQRAAKARSARLHAQESLVSYRDLEARAKARQAKIEEAEARRKEESEIASQRRAYDRDVAASRSREDAQAEVSDERPAKRRGTVTTRSPRPGYTPRQPLTAQESQARQRQSVERFERARSERDPYSSDYKLRTGGNRTVIDARGTIDSRAFNEEEIISNMTIDERDKHFPETTTNDGGYRWQTRAARREAGVSTATTGVPGSGNLFSDSSSKITSTIQNLPPFVKIAIPVIIILVIILIVLLVRG